MGFYVNPPNESKEAYLNRVGKLLPKDVKVEWENKPKHSLPVVLIDNGMFTAAGIAYSKREWEAFNLPDDHRPKQVFMVEIEDLIQVTGEGLERYIEK